MVFNTVHTDHLISASFDTYPLQIGHVPEIDFLNQHHYRLDRTFANGMFEDLAWFNYSSNGSSPEYNKPIMHGEIGAAHYMGCTGSVPAFIDNTYPTHHNQIWASTFSGSFVAGLEWWDKGLDLGYFVDDILGLRNFMEGSNLDADNFVPRKYILSDPVEAFMLQNNNALLSTKVIGWVHNNSYYWYNFIQDSNCTDYYNAQLKASFDNSGCPNYTPNDTDAFLCPQDIVSPNFEIANMKPSTSFGIEWYSTSTGLLISTSTATSNTQGVLYVITPDMNINTSHDYAYKIHELESICSLNDYVGIRKTGNSNKDEVLLNNRCTPSNKVLRSLNISTGVGTIMNHSFDLFNGWVDDADKIFIGDINNDDNDEIILVGTGYLNGAIIVVNVTSGDILSWIDHGTFQGWMDDSDKMFLGDINNDGKEDLVLVGVGNVGGAIRAVDLNTGGNWAWINHGNIDGHATFEGWMDATDKMFLGDVNNDGKEDLVLVNTDYTNGAIRAIDITTGLDIFPLINHGTFQGWMDDSDKMFLGDVNNDGKEDLVFVGVGSVGGAIRAVDIATGGNWAWINHGTFDGWMDATDKILLEDVNGDNRSDLILINTSAGANLRIVDIMNNGNLAWETNALFNEFKDCEDRVLVGDVVGNSNKDLIFVNSSNINSAFLTFDISTEQYVLKNHNDYSPELDGWKDGIDNGSLCNNGSSKLGNL